MCVCEPRDPRDTRRSRNLDQLRDHVKNSKVLVLVQTKSVLTRPYCLIEVLTALEHRIPIVGGACTPAAAPSSRAPAPPDAACVLPTPRR